MSLRRAAFTLTRSLPSSTILRSSASSSFTRSLSTLPSRTSFKAPASVSGLQQQKRWASGGGPSKEDIERRVLEVLQTFEKCDPTKITPTASFTADLGLDSLDAVEVVMAIEEEFSIEIPDEEADKITTVSEAISYIARTPEAN